MMRMLAADRDVADFAAKWIGKGVKWAEGYGRFAGPFRVLIQVRRCTPDRRR